MRRFVIISQQRLFCHVSSNISGNPFETRWKVFAIIRSLCITFNSAQNLTAPSEYLQSHFHLQILTSCSPPIPLLKYVHDLPYILVTKNIYWGVGYVSVAAWLVNKSANIQHFVIVEPLCEMMVSVIENWFLAGPDCSPFSSLLVFWFILNYCNVIRIIHRPLLPMTVFLCDFLLAIWRLIFTSLSAIFIFNVCSR